MKIADNTILITGGGSGIGRALAEAFHKAGNRVIISGRRQAVLDEVTAANPGMASMVMDATDAAGIRAFAEALVKAHPTLNAVINNAGIMRPEDIAAAPDYLDTAEETIATNLLAPIRLTAALLPHFLKQPAATVLTVSSGLAFVPMVLTPTYSATKSAIHAYSIALREQLKATPVEIIEIVPPYVQTTLMGEGQASDERAMPLDAFISEVMDILENRPDEKEVVVERCKPLRFAAQNGNFDQVFAMVNHMHP
ncbi:MULTISPECIES: SDR family oxidoreductase [unclassified Agrobacterium]|uniref:SDR family oxidoreductase n=1 Tax=unclassified Agrobacterium TaxID=2632611 RepID=UPI00244B3F84|nr:MULTISPECIES: SDR family oxidoreductase [unclassified Agrobacterium]MDH0616787.1 SDR family oxidoreductase [Agrobacterium sp. GD03872]MDH0698115.1 SDR family oxidoreductase [Agrobacterium sp. GD03871]MDH1062474.1 SDR family oxidoreductase [Agrobacterium sp. GD03992]MDH2211768.1 SDR family oxidoreductase [Agrobacterium sp. GD03643]MDH2222445.1 SDR family oxidoreductase [Agrobacterium sp. GD03638]